MRKYLQRSLCLFLCVVMAISCMVVPAGAVAPAIVAAAQSAGKQILAWAGGQALDKFLQDLKDWNDGKNLSSSAYVASVRNLETAQKTKVTEDYLCQLAYEWNRDCYEAVGFTVDMVDYRTEKGEVYRVLAVRRGYVITSTAVQYCLADGMSRILYADVTTNTSGRWVDMDDICGTRYLLPYIDLFNLANEVGGMLRLKDNWFEIYNRNGELYCNTSGYVFSTIYENDKAAISQDRPTTGGTIIEGDTVTNIENTYNEDNDTTINNDYSQNVDIENMTQWLPGSTQNNIDSLIYNPDTKTYYIDSHDTTNYNTNFYLYQYHINYTNITYIGQTEEYDKRYELYYQLPDGRDSADLTPEDLEQLNVSIDVIPYVRSTDNFDIRSLYHFDGDVLDSSYWNYLTAFDWSSGGSLTYMDAGAFNGALYLDENTHDFTLTLPGTLDTRYDWTLQFRYYQSHTITPVKDSFVYVGGSLVLQLDGQSLYTSSGSKFSPAPVGTWNEICIVRQDGILYYYLNGVYCASASDNIYRSTTAVRFVFGDGQQTYKYFDELRFARGALYTPGQNYTPTAVPHDSNLTLVLPTGSDGVADETMVFTPSSNNLLTAYKLDDWSKSAANQALIKTENPMNGLQSLSGYPFILNSSSGSSVVWRSSGYSQFNFPNTSFTTTTNGVRVPANCIALPLFHQYYVDDGCGAMDGGLYGAWQTGQIYTLSIVSYIGSVSSVTFRINDLPVTADDYYQVEILNTVNASSFQFSVHDFGNVTWVEEENDLNWRAPITFLCFNSTIKNTGVKYIELVKGSTSDFEISFESSIYDAGELEDAPILAVKTDVVISGYQIGGVRPSVPQKGRVWALVESGYITSLQVYNGFAWESVDGRIWTGSRWIPVSSFNIITLQDMYDIVDATADYEYIYTESGFWDWFQRAWKDLISRLDKILDGMGLGASACQHVYNSQADKAPSCTDIGHITYICSLCQHTYSEVVDPSGHNWAASDSFGSEPEPDPGPDPDTSVFAITKQPVSVTASVGETVYFSVRASGEGLTYYWQFRADDSSSWASPGFTGRYTNTVQVPATLARNGYQMRCRVKDANGNTLYSNVAILTVLDYVIVTCTRCGAVGQDHGDGVIIIDGSADKEFTVRGLILDSLDGVWSVVVGVVNTSFGGLGAFVEGFAVLPDFFALYKPSNEAGVLGIKNYGGADIWD